MKDNKQQRHLKKEMLRRACDIFGSTTVIFLAHDF
jgi:hypothetical protein